MIRCVFLFQILGPLSLAQKLHFSTSLFVPDFSSPFLLSLVIFVSCVHIACFIWHDHDDMVYDELRKKISRS